MKLSAEELEVLSKIKCYKDYCDLAKSEIYDDEIVKCVMENWGTFKETISNWFYDIMSDRIETGHGKMNLCFYTDEPDYRVRELLLKIHDEYDIKDTETFEKIVKKLKQ